MAINWKVFFTTVFAGLALFLIIQMMTKRKVNPTTGYIDTEFTGFDFFTSAAA